MSHIGLMTLNPRYTRIPVDLLECIIHICNGPDDCPIGVNDLY
jgi:hypothetical protein